MSEEETLIRLIAARTAAGGSTEIGFALIAVGIRLVQSAAPTDRGLEALLQSVRTIWDKSLAFTDTTKENS